MVASALIYDVENPEAQVSNSRRQQPVCSHTVVQVLMGVLVVFTLVVAGSVIWMKTSQDHAQHIWLVRFTGTNTSFTSPRTQNYSILVKVSSKSKGDVICDHWLLQKSPKNEAVGESFSEFLMVYDKELQKGTTLSLWPNCDHVTIDESKSMMIVFQQNN